jgi:hypothetical protein
MNSKNLCIQIYKLLLFVEIPIGILELTGTVLLIYLDISGTLFLLYPFLYTLFTEFSLVHLSKYLIVIVECGLMRLGP